MPRYTVPRTANCDGGALTMATPCCHDCLSGDVAVKVIDPCGFEHWFCAADWAAQQEFGERIMTLLGDAARALEQR